MKTYIKYSCTWAILIVLLSCISSCKKDANTQQPAASDKATISTAIDAATALYTNSTEGKRAGLYSVGSRADLKKAIDLATATKNATQYSQREVDNATANLNRALGVFKSRQIQDVSSDNLIAKWDFTGNANDVSGHGHNGILMTGYINSTTDGNTLPKLVADRYNAANSAFDFANGSNIEIPYTTDLNPKEFTITMWVKRRETNPDNYMIALNSYNGFKFQLQGSNFMFLTLHVDDGYRDVDSNPGVVPQDVWTYIGVSYINGTMKFYVNDKLVKTAAVTGTPVTLPTPVNLVIGQNLPKSLKGQSYFRGAMDDIRYYSRALTDAEVLSIYTTEQP
ncbi:LamG-like jellyroll fold domain-containing protein [Mucilaginibacter galii]|uniref:LamG-like jellyroll fold domain-containing protein n=1 Tax=Mucilaginibacter galii TaxID=2005073 RepID=A0A917J7A2_9SPHI|nr:LamG-like jellyroll fold domain-containing protein [Mucilaginibacter galii]GGI49816.1 hypothetical protein GCM10011425_10280 [Mucilaginibacter galii]